MVRPSGFLSAVERIGNRLPDPATLFVLLGAATLLASALGAWAGWSVVDPRDPSKTVAVRSLLDADGLRWILTQAIRNFLDFPPLAIVLVAMLGIGVAERTGLFPALLKLLVIVTPRALLSPAVVFIGVMSSAAADAGYVVLPPLAAGVFARVGRPPLAGIAAATFGVAGGFSANLGITSLDPLLQGLTEQAARAVDPDAIVRADCNWYFMVASTFLITAVGWFVTDRIVAPRFDRVAVERQLAQGGRPPATSRSARSCRPAARSWRWHLSPAGRSPARYSATERTPWFPRGPRRSCPCCWSSSCFRAWPTAPPAARSAPTAASPTAWARQWREWAPTWCSPFLRSRPSPGSASPTWRR
jgi:p-aminobenzoyl-glutamate transporter AbgT